MMYDNTATGLLLAFSMTFFMYISRNFDYRPSNHTDMMVLTPDERKVFLAKFCKNYDPFQFSEKALIDLGHNRTTLQLYIFFASQCDIDPIFAEFDFGKDYLTLALSQKIFFLTNSKDVEDLSILIKNLPVIFELDDFDTQKEKKLFSICQKRWISEYGMFRTYVSQLYKN